MQQFQVKIAQETEEESRGWQVKEEQNKAQARGESRREVMIAHYCSCDETPIKLNKNTTVLCNRKWYNTTVRAQTPQSAATDCCDLVLTVDRIKSLSYDTIKKNWQIYNRTGYKFVQDFFSD